jgi:N-acylneuraminate cytidylyltransferase
MIPARGGSKRIPRKNVKPFAGKPIIQYSIEAALACGSIDRVIVSTDDDEIADVAGSLGAEVPFRRPEKLSDDHATTLDVIRHALDWGEGEGGIEAICCIYATAPFVTAADLDAAYGLLSASGAGCVFAATEYAFPIQRAFAIENQRVRMFQPEHLNTRSQDLERAYHDAGQFYWCRPEAVRSGQPIMGPGSLAYMMGRERVQDIDTPQDWTFAENLFRLLR